MGHEIDHIRRGALECLLRWAPFSEQYWYVPSSRPDLGCFGSGYDNWGVQTNQKYLAAMGVLAAEGDTGSGFSTDTARDRFLASLRFSLASHLTGDHHCTDGRKWGHTWISPLGIERMMHAVNLMDTTLTNSDRSALEKMLMDEADHQLSTDIVADPWGASHRNKPESNIWNGAVCARAALRFPDHPHSDRWLEKANSFWINGISIPADADDETIVAGKPVKERHIGANFFPNYALDHHSYLNVGYMVICLSNIAMIHYAYVLRGREAPEALYHHARELWGLVRRLVFRDGRLLRIGGDTRIRYCYCQDYLLPTLVLAADYWKDSHALGLLEGAVDLIRQEQDLAENGRFLSERCSEIERRNPYYYTRLEADKAAALSMVVHWLRQRTICPPEAEENFETSVAGNWQEEEHGAVIHRCETRFASWSWRAAEPPQGLCLPPSDGHLAEWAHNLGGGLKPVGKCRNRLVQDFRIHSFDGGFLTCGTMEDGPEVYIAEGWNAPTTASHFLVFAALPDGHTVLRMEYAVPATRRVYLENLEGVNLEIPNDVFNGRIRRYFRSAGRIDLEAHEGSEQFLSLESGWVNVEDVLGLIGIYGADTWSVLRRGKRIGGHAFGNILTDTLCYGLQTRTIDIQRPAAVIDNAVVILSSVNSGRTRRLAEEGLARRVEITGDNEALRAVLVPGLDGARYVLAANASETEARAGLALPEGTWSDASTGEPYSCEGTLNVILPSSGAVLLLEQQD